MKAFASLLLAVTFMANSSAAALYYPDNVNKGPLNVFRRDTLHCGGSWKFTGLIWGDRPVSACMIKTKKKNVFGGEF